ncbi:ArsA family ATPase [Actinokineospora fastidiosa]|uniref:ArsA family ATPase n=1 Tax=Actinokineospora fastidiosa TaxID=1816 RepID=UPI001670E52C|nr:ArsA family ATPase [Actinokineospora fastidiosa]
MRLLLFTGKGGVGKTTLAAATAVRVADSGDKVLVVSTDPAHSLADAFGVRLGGEPSEVDKQLWAAHVDARALADRQWSGLRSQARSLFARLGLDAVDAEELAVLPGVDDLLALSEVVRLASAGPWKAVVVDCGPTAETLRLLALPEAASGFLARFGELRKLAAELARLRSILADPTATGVRLVLTPERLVVAETRRTMTALALRGIRVDALIVNRLVPRARHWPGPAAAWLRTRRSEQDAVLSALDSALPVSVVEHRAAEPVGVPALRSLADELYGPADPLDTGPAADRLLSITTDGEDHLLTIAFPITDDATLTLARIDDDLSITVDGVRKLIALPLILRHHTVTDATASATGLVLRFTPPTA